MSDDCYQPPPLKSIEIRLDVSEGAYEKLMTAMAEQVIFVVTGVGKTFHYDSPPEDEWTLWADLQSLGTTARLK